MKVRIKVPRLGLTIEDVTLSCWERQVGDAVKAGDVIATVEADKANYEIVAPADGSLIELQAAEGDTVPVGETIAVLET